VLAWCSLRRGGSPHRDEAQNFTRRRADKNAGPEEREGSKKRRNKKEETKEKVRKERKVQREQRQ
jgi:hypothetical protein